MKKVFRIVTQGRPNASGEQDSEIHKWLTDTLTTIARETMMDYKNGTGITVNVIVEIV